MKRIKWVLLLILLLPSVCMAKGGISVSKSTVNVYVGGTAKINISSNQAFATIQTSVVGDNISITYPESTIDMGETKSFTITGKSVGQSKIVLSFVVAPYDTATPEEYNDSRTITVNVTEKPTTTTTTTEPTTTTEATTIAPSDISINNIKIVGYSLDFDKNKIEYTINVDKDTNELYVIVEGDNLEVEGDGLIDIKDKDSFDIKVKQGGSELTYKIKINKTEGKKSNNMGLYICIAVLSFLALGLTILVVYLAKKN